MQPLVTCPNGHQFASAFRVGGTGRGTATFRDNIESCPYCGALSKTPNGTFRFGDRVWEALRAPSVTRETVENFRDIAASLRAGQTTTAAAVQEIGAQNTAFANLLAWTNANDKALVLLLAILQLFIATYAIWDSNQSDAVAHADAQQTQQAIVSQTRAIQTQTEVLRNAEAARATAAEAQRRIDEEIARMNAWSLSRATGSEPITAMQRSNPPRMPNRHERRKAKRLQSRRP